MAEVDLRGVRVLLVFHSFKHDTDTLAFIKNVRHLGVIPPLNLLYASAWLRRHGAETEVLDCNALNVGLDEALARARALRFDFVCFSVTNLDFLFAIAWVRAFARTFGKPVLVGGLAPENFPAEVAAHPEIHTAFHGPAEAALVEWLRAYVGGGEWWRVPGTASRHDGAVVLNPPARLPPRFARPWPDRERVDASKYYSILAKGSPFTAGMSSHGCPFGCEFCQIRRTPYFSRTAEDLVGELEFCERELGVQEIDYFDAGFTVPRGRVFEFAELYRRRGLRIRWSARVRADQIDPELLAAMASANCAWIGYGIESGDDEVLRNIKKPQGGTSRIREVLRQTKEAGIGTTGFFVMGLPGESPQTLENTLAFIEGSPLDFVQISPYWPVPNTPIYDRIVRETGVDVWKQVITDGARRDDMPLAGTRYTVKDMHRVTAQAYSEFYFRPAQLLNMLGNVTTRAQFGHYLSAGVDVLRGAASQGARRVLGRLPLVHP